MTKTVFHKASALLLSAVMATTAFCSALAVSAAEPDNASDDAKPLVYHIDRSRTASLTVYKYEVPDTSVAYSGSTGEKDDEAHIPEEAKPLKGVTFAAYKFAELDEYFTEASSEIPKTEDYREDKVTATFTATTGADGVAVFKDLPLGFYYVDEINGPAQITKKIEPFVLSLPLTNAGGTEWLYDVYSYPKNETIHKSVLSEAKGEEGVDTTKKIGDTVNWKIKTSIPSLKEDLEVMKVYKITDTMTKGLSYKSASLMLDDKKALAVNTDYTVSQSDLTVTFDIKPASLIGYHEVEVYFDTVLNSEAAIATDIPNTSVLEYSNTATSTHKIDSEEPTVHTGEYKFKKKDAQGNPIKGVQFAVYADEQSAKNGANAIMTAESNDEGIVSFKGLAYGKFAKTAAQKAADGVDGGSTEYWINEIKTGNGYNLLKEPVKITVNKTSGDVTKTYPMINTDTPKLTPTGGAAYGVMIGGAGIAVLGAALVWILVKAKKKNKKDAAE